MYSLDEGVRGLTQRESGGFGYSEQPVSLKHGWGSPSLWSQQQQQPHDSRWLPEQPLPIQSNKGSKDLDRYSNDHSLIASLDEVRPHSPSRDALTAALDNYGLHEQTLTAGKGSDYLRRWGQRQVLHPECDQHQCGREEPNEHHYL